MISVIMAAYNSSNYIALAIESILNQTFREFELLIVDDCSTDNTLEIAKSYAERDSRITIFQTEKNSGVSAARNLAIQSAKYSWLAIMDSDDLAQPERLEKQINAVKENPTVIGWGTYAQHISSTGKHLSLVQQGTTTTEKFYELREAGHVPFVIHPSTLINKEIFLKVGGYITQLETYSITAAEDFELFDRMANYGPILVIPEPLLLYRIHSQSLSMQKFFWQKKLTRYVVARHQARLAGKEELRLSQFIKEYDSQSRIARLTRYLRTIGQFCYRKAGLLFAEQNYLFAGWYLIMALVVNPSYSKSRLWRQKLSPQAKQSLKQSELTRAH